MYRKSSVDIAIFKKVCDTKLYFFLFSRTPSGRARAWLRLALMQKKLADYFRHLVDQGDEVLSDFYEPRALLRSEESAIGKPNF